MGSFAEIGCPYGFFAILTSHIIPFWNLQDQGNVLGAKCRYHVYHQGDQNGQECLLNGVFGGNWVYLWDFCHLNMTYDMPLIWFFFIFLIIIMVIMMLPVYCPVPKDSKKVSHVAKYHQDFQVPPTPHLEDIPVLPDHPDGDNKKNWHG